MDQYAPQLALANNRRASYLRANAAALRGTLADFAARRFGAAAVLLGVSGVALLIGYWALLSDAGLHVPVLALLAILLASTLSSIGGFAFSAISGAMLLHLMTGQVMIVEVMLVCSIAIQSLSIAVLWRSIDWRGVSVFFAGGIVGLPLGVYLLTHLPVLGFRLAIGVLLTAYALYMLLRRPVTLRFTSRAADAAVGFVGGVTGGLAAFPGAAVTVWCGMKGWDKTRQRGIYQPFILMMQFAALGLIQIMPKHGPAHAALGLGALAFIPAALMGAAFGLSLFYRLSDRHFAMVVNALLLVSGLALLY